MRTLMIVVAVLLAGCSRQPDLTPEQKTALQMLGEINSPDNVRQVQATARLEDAGKQFSAPADVTTWRNVHIAILTEASRRVRDEGLHSSSLWLDSESKKPTEQLIREWTPKPTK